MRFTIFDYGAGNVHSLAKALGVPGVNAGEPLFARAPLDAACYANSYVCRPADERRERSGVAWSTHEAGCLAAAARLGSAVVVPLHPEQSVRAGVAFVRAVVVEAGQAGALR